MDQTPDPQAPDPGGETLAVLLAAEVDSLLSRLDPRQRRIVVLRFGLHDGRVWSLVEVGRDLGVTRERVRQIEAVALRNLKALAQGRVGRHLHEYLVS